MFRTAIILGVFGIVGALLVAFTFDRTEEPIAEAHRRYLLKTLHELMPPDAHDNDVYTDTIEVTSRELLGADEPLTVYRARQGGRPVAAILSTVAPDGYNGAIRLLVAIRHDGTLAGVRVIQHRETPGLGDGVEANRSDWILGFNGRSLTDPPPRRWKVKRDGGVFDQFTGATITPRAVVGAVYRALLYFQGHRDALFAEPGAADEETPETRG